MDPHSEDPQSESFEGEQVASNGMGDSSGEEGVLHPMLFLLEHSEVCKLKIRGGKPRNDPFLCALLLSCQKLAGLTLLGKFVVEWGSSAGLIPLT